jgi:hypothetical protein
VASKGWLFGRWAKRNRVMLEDLYRKLQDISQVRTLAQKEFSKSPYGQTQRILKTGFSVATIASVLYGISALQEVLPEGPIQTLVAAMMGAFFYAILHSSMAPLIEKTSALIRKFSYLVSQRRGLRFKTAELSPELRQAFEELYSGSAAAMDDREAYIRDQIILMMTFINVYILEFKEAYSGYLESIAELQDDLARKNREGYHYQLAYTVYLIPTFYPGLVSRAELVLKILVKPLLNAPNFDASHIDIVLLKKYLKDLDTLYLTDSRATFYDAFFKLLEK